MQGRHVVSNIDNRERCRIVQQFFGEQRQTILAHRRAASRTLDGVLPANPFGMDRTAAGLRRHLDAKGEISVEKDLSPDFILVVKHIGSFAAMLGELVRRFPVFVMIRNPLAVLSSWSTLDAPLRCGHIGPAERIDDGLRARLTSIEDPLDRQIQLLSWFFEQFERYIPEHAILRYESIIESKGQSLSVIRPDAKHLREPLESQNVNQLYDREYMKRAGERLLSSQGAYWQFYSPDSVSELIPALDTPLSARDAS
jgi:hypothetical protein